MWPMFQMSGPILSVPGPNDFNIQYTTKHKHTSIYLKLSSQTYKQEKRQVPNRNVFKPVLFNLERLMFQSVGVTV